MNSLEKFLKSVELDRKNVEGTNAKRIPWTHNTKKLAVQALQEGYNRQRLAELSGINVNQFYKWKTLDSGCRLQASNAIAYSHKTKNPRQDPFPDLTMEQLLEKIRSNKEGAKIIEELTQDNSKELKSLKRSLNIKVNA